MTQPTPASSTDTAAATDEHNDSFVEFVRSLAIAAVLALLIRTFLYEPFNIPSGSMFPTLLIGDYLFVEKYAYGYSQYSFPFGLASFSGRIWASPVTRGDVAVFRQPKKPEIDYIKRIVGLPGDRIQVIDGVLHINGQAVERTFVSLEPSPDLASFQVLKKYIETLPGGRQHYIYELSDTDRFDNTPEYTVPPGHYFAMGDNRDNSLDSRAMDDVGFIPADNLVGRAVILFFSTEGVGGKCDIGGDDTWGAVRRAACGVVEWPQAIRLNRIFTRVQTFTL